MAPLSEAQQLETLLELQRDLALEANVEKVLGRITVAATTMLDAERATLYVVDQTRNEIWSRALTEGRRSVSRLTAAASPRKWPERARYFV